jgi:hypothetical protein
LINVGPHPHQLTHLDAHLVRAVDDRARHAGMRVEPEVRAGRQPAVAVAAGLADHAEADLHPGAADEAVLHRLLHPEIRPAGVAHRRDADAQCRLEVVHRLVEAIAERRLDAPHRVDGAEGDVGVAVEQPRQERLSGDVDAFVTVQPGADLDDPPVLDHHIGIGWVGARAVDHASP